MSDIKYVYTGVSTDAETEKSLRSGFAVPFMATRSGPPPDPHVAIHAAALAAGLPEIPGHYGYDFERHEFIRLPDEAIAKPTAPAATRVLEMFGHPKLTLRTTGGRRYTYEDLVLEPHGVFEAAELAAALKEYRASLVPDAAKANAEALTRAAAKAHAAMELAVGELPDDMRGNVLREHFPELYGR